MDADKHEGVYGEHKTQAHCVGVEVTEGLGEGPVPLDYSHDGDGHVQHRH